jgi:hypothetical protein
MGMSPIGYQGDYQMDYTYLPLAYRVRKGVAYYADIQDAINESELNNGRIVSYELGWAVQRNKGGVYWNGTSWGR